MAKLNAKNVGIFSCFGSNSSEVMKCIILTQKGFILINSYSA